MARSVFLHPEHKETARLALGRNGFLTQGDLSANLGIALSTVNNFFNCKPVSISKFEQICEVLNLDKRAILKPIAASKPISVTFSAYNPQTFTGREAEIAQFTTLLSGSCRILAVTGMTGIGKTALAERVVANLMESPKSSTLPYIRFSLDDRSLSLDFSISGAALLRTLGEEPTLADQQDAANLLAHILKRLCSNPCRLQIDSLERLLKGNEQEGWSEFCDPLWLDLLHQFVAGNDCPSQILLTSQDVTGDLDAVASRYSEFYRCQTLRGLKSDEQRDFFQKLGLLADSDSTVTDLDYLNRIGAFYDGHPLVLQVIADEILQPPFQGNVARYWHHYEAEFSETDAPTTNKLARSCLFRRRVKQRVKQTIQRLPSLARQMLCACAVFRRPVPMGFWLAMLTDKEPQAEFDTLQNRHLVEFVSASDDTLLVRQHNLIRSVAYDFLKANASIWEQAERQAADLWLTEYKPVPDTLNLETVRGYLEAFEHYCEAGDWDAASEIYTYQLATTNAELNTQLFIWGYFRELLAISRMLVDKITSKIKGRCLIHIGGCYRVFGSMEKSIDYAQQALQFYRTIGDRFGESLSLGDLGVVYRCLGNYEWAINFLQQSLVIAQQVDALQWQASCMGNLGTIYNYLGKYEQSIDLHQQELVLSRKMGWRLGESNALCNLGSVSYRLGQYEQTIDYAKQHLTIAREIGARPNEGVAQGSLGMVYQTLGQYEQAIYHLKQYLTIAREIGDRQSESSAQSDLGLVYQDLGQYERAIDLHQQALVISREIGDRQGEGVHLGNLGLVYRYISQYDQSIDILQQRLIIAQEIGDREGEAIALGNLGSTYCALADYSKALALHQQKLAIARKICSRLSESSALSDLGEVFIKLEHYSDALTVLQNALEICRELGARYLEAEILKNFADLYQALGKIEMARRNCRQALTLATELGMPLAAKCQTLMESLDREAGEAKVVQEEIS